MCNYKVCVECGAILPKSKDFFFSHKHGKDGFENKCKECVKKRRRRRYKNVVYEIYCNLTNSYYIGQTIKPITERMSKHFSDAKSGRKQPLYEDIRTYGKDAFEYKILEETDTIEELDDLERYYIRKYLNEGKVLYNRELGGRKNIEIPQNVRREMSKSQGVKEFLVFDLDGFFLGEFQTISEANQELGYFNYSKYMDNTDLNSKDFLVFSKEKFNYDLLAKEVKAYRYLEDNVRYNEKTYHKGTRDISEDKNPMYGKHGEDNPNSKKVYIVKNGQIEEFKSASLASEKYGFQVRYYARGGSNHYYKKLNLYVYYEDKYVRDKDEESYD
jgi:group I intron endonuclease